MKYLSVIVVTLIAILTVSGCAPSTAKHTVSNSYLQDPSLSETDKRIITLFNNKEYEYAHQLILQELESNPSDISLHYHLGLLFLRQGLPKDAEPEFRKVLELDATHQQALFNLGYIELQRNNFDEARKLYTQVLVISPDDPDTHYNIALVYDKLFKKENALYHYRKCLDYFRNDRAKQQYIRAIKKRIDELEFLVKKDKS